MHTYPKCQSDRVINNGSAAGKPKKQCIIVSKSIEMVDLTMALFAKFWVNGNQDALLSLLA
jgi:hypothetical protein